MRIFRIISGEFTERERVKQISFYFYDFFSCFWIISPCVLHLVAYIDIEVETGDDDGN